MSSIRDKVLETAGSCGSFSSIVEKLLSGSVEACIAMSVIGHCTATRIALGLGIDPPRGLLAPAITEPRGGSSLQNPASYAVLSGEDWLVNGAKMFVTNGLHADHIIVYLQAKGEPAVALVASNSRGVEAEPMRLPAYKCSGIASIRFNSTRAELLVAGREAYKAVLRGLAESRILVAALAVGLGKTVLLYALEWAKARGLTGFQAVTHRAARAYALLKTVENHVYTVARLVDEKKLEDWTLSSIAKYVAVEAALEAVEAARRTMGGHAFVDEKLQELEKHVEALEPAEGTQDIQLEIIARKLFY